MSAVQSAVPVTGPEAIAHALDRIDPAALEAEMRAIVRSRKVSKRPRAIDVLNTLEGLKRNNLKPGQLMISSVPVIPAQFRPFAIVGDTFTPGDANELYRDLFKVRDAYEESRQELGEQGTKEARLHLYDAVRALYGYRDPVEPKTLQRGVSGFLQKVTGTNPKLGYIQRQLLAKPMDNVGRAVIGVDPNLGLDEVGIPYNMAWRMYAPYVQSKLVQSGMSASEALKAIRDRTDVAKHVLHQEVKVRPCLASRAPAWHKFSTVAGHPKLIEGDTVMVNPFITAGAGADFDGDQMNIHVPSMDDAVKEAYEKLMPSKMIFSDRNYDTIPSVPKHEGLLGIYSANTRKATQTHQFPDEESAHAAIKKGKVRLNDEVTFPSLTPPFGKVR
jgi:DNA-directed RNA polymerase beta' subunit